VEVPEQAETEAFQHPVQPQTRLVWILARRLALQQDGWAFARHHLAQAQPMPESVTIYLPSRTNTFSAHQKPGLFLRCRY
jgi:hypothetical protein